MSNQYQYRKHLTYIRNIFPIFIAVILVFLGVLIVINRPSIIVISMFSFFSIFMILFSVFIWIFYGRFTLVKVSIDSDAIIYTNYKGDTIIKYEDITEIKFPSLNYLGGWIEIKTAKKTIRLTVVIENIHTFLLELKCELDKRGLANKYNYDKYFMFLKTSIYSDDSWRRVYNIWWKLFLSTILAIGISVATGILLDFGIILGLTVFLSFVIPTIVYLITEIIFGRRVAKLSDKNSFYIPEPDLQYEASINKKAVLWGSLAFIIILVMQIILSFVAKFINYMLLS